MKAEISIQIFPQRMLPITYSRETTTRRLQRDLKKMARRVTCIKSGLQKEIGNAGMQPIADA